MILVYHLIFGAWVFAVGSVIGSFLNVCIYRIPWQKSVIWPASHCPRCLSAITARDNIPILGWLLLRGRCRACKTPIPARYPLVELLVGLLFVAVYIVDIASGPDALRAGLPFGRMAYHLTLVVLLVAATFIDYDLQIIPDSITVTGMVVGLAGGLLIPAIRTAPGAAATPWQGLAVGLVGLLVGGGLTWTFRTVFSLALRREAMGFGDVTLMAMIGSFLGWQAAVLCFFLAPFCGILHAAWKFAAYVRKSIAGGQTSAVDREMPFGPYLSMAALGLVLSWPWLWPGWGQEFFANLVAVGRFLLTGA